jgi:YfiH family protein
MSLWHKKQVGQVTLFQASTMSWLPQLVQGFTSRSGGTSTGDYESLNLGLNCGDNPDNVARNREILAQSLGIQPEQMVYAEQVHGSSVAVVTADSPRLIAGTDALITNERGVYLTLLFADCFPIYIVEPHKRIAAIAHAGWRGLDSTIIRSTTERLVSSFGVSPSLCQVSVGPGISAENYEVDSDVADRFRESSSAGASVAVMPKREMTGKWDLNLRSIIFTQLLTLGYRPESISMCDIDTYSSSAEFFSHRRESQAGKSTGRMAAVLGFRPYPHFGQSEMRAFA